MWPGWAGRLRPPWRDRTGQTAPAARGQERSVCGERAQRWVCASTATTHRDPDQRAATEENGSGFHQAWIVHRAQMLSVVLQFDAVLRDGYSLMLHFQRAIIHPDGHGSHGQAALSIELPVLKAQESVPRTVRLSSLRKFIAEQGEKRNEDDSLPCREKRSSSSD